MAEGDYKGCPLISFKKQKFAFAFDCLRDGFREYNFSKEDRQKWGEYVARAAHKSLKRKKEEISPYCFDTIDTLRGALRYAVYSTNPKMIRIALELSDMFKKTEERDYGAEMHKSVKMFLQGKLAGKSHQTFVDYLTREAERLLKEARYPVDDNVLFTANLAAGLLTYHKRYNEALDVVERFFPPDNKTRIRFVEDLNKKDALPPERIAAACRRIDNPFDYIHCLAKPNGKK